MLKKKNITAPTGAGMLADIMANMSSGMDIYPLPLMLLDDAPEAWNFYRPLPEDKFFELMESIREKGLLAPLIVWKRGERYMILSGHNRKRALQRLHDITGEQRFSQAHCLVRQEDSLSEDDAQALLIDANWCQRSLSPSERAKSICRKYAILGRAARGSGRSYEALAEQYGLHATQIYQYTRIAALEKCWLERLDEGLLTIKACVRLASFSPQTRAALVSAGSPALPLSSAEILALPGNLTPESARGAAERARAKPAGEAGETPVIRTIEVPERYYARVLAFVRELVAGE